jgi:hypothetical protein
MIIGRFTTNRMIKYFFIIGLIAALVPAAVSSIPAPASAERGLFSFISSYNDNTLKITGNGKSADLAPDFVNVGERLLFGGSINDESNDDNIIGTLPQPSQRDQGEDTGNGTHSMTIDPASSESLTILSQRISTDESLADPFMDINGEIQNVGDNSLDFVRATATFYDEANSILGSAFAYTEPITLEPGQTAPYKITAGFGDNIPVDDIANIKLHVTSD